MKLKHNKKRNTAFLYEILMRELTKSILFKNVENKKSLIKIIKEHFRKNSILELCLVVNDLRNLKNCQI